MLHLIQLTLLLVVLTLALTLIQRELLSRLLVNAFRDITGIHNKTSLENKITELGELPSTFGIGVMMFDLNNLKHVNDTYGHEKGDEFIQTFAYCLTRILDSNSFLARYGGDEFIIIQTDTDSEHLKQMQHRLANLVHDYNNQATLPLSYATGYEISQQNHYFMMEDLINAADKKIVSGQNTKKTGSYQAEFFHDPTDKCCYSNRLFRIRYRKDSSASTRCNRQPYHCRYFHRCRKFFITSMTNMVILSEMKF